jgi:hypothetical protein
MLISSFLFRKCLCECGSLARADVSEPVYIARLSALQGM